MPGIGVDVLWEEVAGTAAWRGRRPWQRGDGLLLRDVRWEMLGAQAHNPAGASLQGRVIPLDLFDAQWRAGRSVTIYAATRRISDATSPCHEGDDAVSEPRPLARLDSLLSEKDA